MVCSPLGPAVSAVHTTRKSQKSTCTPVDAMGSMTITTTTTLDGYMPRTDEEEEKIHSTSWVASPVSLSQSILCIRRWRNALPVLGATQSLASGRAPLLLSFWCRRDGHTMDAQGSGDCPFLKHTVHSSAVTNSRGESTSMGSYTHTTLL